MPRICKYRLVATEQNVPVSIFGIFIRRYTITILLSQIIENYFTFKINVLIMPVVRQSTKA